MSFPRYAKYRGSGVEWLGDVPELWEVTPIKYLVKLCSGGTPSKTNLDYWDGTVPWASAKDLKSESLTDTEDHITQFAIDDGAASLVAAGSLLIVVRGMILVHTFPVVKTQVPMAINQDLKAVLPTAKLNVDFLAWLLRASAQETDRRIDEAAHGTKVLRMEAWASMRLPVPPLSDQIRISGFLDRETAKVDALVEEQRRLIELLKEKRQAVISHAVTKGLNPNVSLKPSGIEGLGDVVAHWAVVRMKWVAKMESGHTPAKKVSEYWENCEIPWVSLNDTGSLKNSEYIYDTAYRINESGIANSSARLLPERVVVFSRDATIGRCAITTRPMAVSQHFIAWVCSDVIIPEFLLFRLRSMAEELDRLATGATVKTIGMPDVRTLATPLPPLEEQRGIIKRIRESNAELDALVAEAQRAIDLLQERRTALISAAVTGKIDARGLAGSEAA